MLFCNVCSIELTSDRRTRLKLKGNAVGINDVCSELFDSLMKMYVDILNSPAFTAIFLMNLYLCASPASLFPSPGR